LFLTAGAVLVAASLAVHHDQVELLTRAAGPGWNGAPVVLLCLLAAPNAVIAGASYLAGPGFAFGTGTAVGIGTSTHGVLPAFPILAALPSGPSPGWLWWPVLLAPAAAGVLGGVLALREDGWLARLRSCAVGAALASLAGAVLAWQGGGGIGDGRLQTIGASPWQLGLALGGELAAGGVVTIALSAGWAGVREFAAVTKIDGPTPVLWAAADNTDDTDDVAEDTDIGGIVRADPDAVTERLDAVDRGLLRDRRDGAGGGRLAG
jgi:hypothetical protein